MQHNCPFYGYAMIRVPMTSDYPFVLVPTLGNQCALVRNAHAPCQMEINGEPVEWSKCPLVQSIRKEAMA